MNQVLIKQLRNLFLKIQANLSAIVMVETSNIKNIRESEICNKLINLEFGIGGKKK